MKSEQETAEAKVEVKTLCTMSKAECKELGMKLLDLCVICGIHVGRHHIEPTIPVPKPVSHTYQPFKNFKAPIFNRSQSVNVFVKNLEHLMTAQSIDEMYWPKVFLMVLESTSSKDWVSKNIILPGLEWSAAKTSFISHFRNADYELQIQIQWQDMKQRKNESVQEFIDRFNALAEELHYDEERLQKDFLLKVDQKLHVRYRNDTNVGKRNAVQTGTTFKPYTLTEIQNICIEYAADSYVPVQSEVQTKHHANNSSSTSTTTSTNGRKFCINHPHLSNHSTSECRISSKRRSDEKSTPTKPPNTTTNTSTTSGQVKCYTCHEFGHKSPDCPSKNTATYKPRNHPSQPIPPLTRAAAKTAAPTTSPEVRRMDVECEDGDGLEVDTRGVTRLESELGPVLAATTDTLIRGLVFVINGVNGSNQAGVCVDTGCTRSIMDLKWAQELGIPITEGKGVLRLAVNDLTVPRHGTTPTLEVTALYGSQHQTSGLPSTKKYQHSFEVATLHSEYKFLLGMDLMWTIFDEQQGVPAQYINVYTGIKKDANAKLGSVSINGYDEVGLDVLKVSVLEELDDNIIPEEEKPSKPIMITDPILEKEYKHKRELVTASLSELLDINEALTGFCNLPESEVVLVVDPSKNLYRKQYKLPLTVEPVINDIVNRWLAEKRIEPAPNNCNYNNPLLVVPKKNSEGEIVGSRVCLDTRALNEALLIEDRFPLPYVNDILTTFGGKNIYGEFDLSEAYLQFALHKDSKKYTAFTWNRQQYVFVGAPFGLTNLPSHFQRNISKIFSDLTFCPSVHRQSSIRINKLGRT